MKYSELLERLQSGEIPPVLTFLGEEAFLKERALESLIERYLDPDTRSFQFHSFSAEDLKDASFLDDASTVPMFGEWKILYVKDATALEKVIGKISDYLQQYLSHPSSTTILVFDVGRWEGRSKLKGILTKNTTVVEFQSLTLKEVPSWINSHLKTLGYTMDRDANQLLVERQGTNLQTISSELEKLMLLAGSEKVIGLKDVEKSVGYSPTATVWEWSEALLDQHSDLAVKRLNDLLEKGEQPVYCVALLARQYEKMILTKEMVRQKIPQAAISKKINKPVYFLQKYLDQLSRFRMEELVKAVQILALADRALKTGQAPERTILEMMTIQLCHLRENVKPVFDVPLAIV